MRLYRYLDNNLFAPPYRLLPLVVFAYVALSFLYHPQSPFQTFTLGDPDDYMRLNEVINWLRGQGWHDLSHPRLSPGAHTVLHWSRLVDLPIAALTWPLIKPFGMMGAAMTASFIVPMILLVFLLALLPALGAPLVGKERANCTTLFALFAPMMLFNFTPGRVDHHNWQLLIAGFGLFCLERLTRDKKHWRFAIFAALAFACGLWIGTEALPWLIVFIACLAVAGAWYGGYILRNGAIFGVALTIATACILPLALPMAEWHSRALSWFSPADVIFAALAGGVLVVGGYVGRLTENKFLRLAVMATLGFFAATVFCHFVPDALIGPFADFDDFDSTTALEHIAEATPLSAAFHMNIHNRLSYMPAIMGFVRFLFVPLLTLAVIGTRIRSAKPKERMLWIFHGSFLSAAFLLTVFWEIRVGWFLQLFTIAPLTWIAFAWWKKIGQTLKGRPRFWAETGAFLVLGPLPVLLLPAALGAADIYPDLVLFPAAHGGNAACPLKQAAEFIASPFGHYTDHQYTILSGANEGAELLFRTPYNVIAANFIVSGNRDVYDFFNARDDKSALAVLRKWHVDLVLTCRSTPPFYAGMDHPRPGVNAFLRAGPDGNLHLVSSLDHPSMIERLVNGHPPRWLKSVEIPTTKDYLLFEVTLPQAKIKTQ